MHKQARAGGSLEVRACLEPVEVCSSREKVSLELPRRPVLFRNTSSSLGELSGDTGKGQGFLLTPAFPGYQDEQK